MKAFNQGLLLAGLAASAFGTAACGPAEVQLDPRTVVNVAVHPASKQRLYCPGDPFQVKLVAKLKDGTSCSSTDRTMGCLKKTDAIIKPADVRVTGSSGNLTGERAKWIWMPDGDPLKTADTGMTLQGWLETEIDKVPFKTDVAEAQLKPVYACQVKSVYVTPGNETTKATLLGIFNVETTAGPHNGLDGSPGPDLKVSVTSLSTPYYPDAALVRIQSGSSVRYVISQSADQPVTIVSKGQAGARGRDGEPGQAGAAGQDATQECDNGGNGGDGTDGGPGGPGGNGGPGGLIHVLLDKAGADKLRGRVNVASIGGDLGPAGRGGNGGAGGLGGKPGKSGPGTGCGVGGRGGPEGKKGTDGRSGKAGADGSAGHPGAAGPEPDFATGTRDSLFGAELATITRIEAAKAK
jgi:hypothetical protein